MAWNRSFAILYEACEIICTVSILWKFLNTHTHIFLHTWIGRPCGSIVAIRRTDLLPVWSLIRVTHQIHSLCIHVMNSFVLLYIFRRWIEVAIICPYIYLSTFQIDIFHASVRFFFHLQSFGTISLSRVSRRAFRWKTENRKVNWMFEFVCTFLAMSAIRPVEKKHLQLEMFFLLMNNSSDLVKFIGILEQNACSRVLHEFQFHKFQS